MPDLFSFLVDPQTRRRLIPDALDDDTGAPAGLLGSARDDTDASVVLGLLSAPSASQRLSRGLLGGDDGASLPIGTDDLQTLLTAPAQIAAPQDDAQFAQLLQQIANQNAARSDRAAADDADNPPPQSVAFTPDYNAQRAGLGARPGNAEADGTAAPATQGQGPLSAADYRNGSDIDSDPAALQRPQDPPVDDGRADIERENRLLASRTRTITGTSPAGMITQDGHNYYLISRDKDGLGVYQQQDLAAPGEVGDKVALPRVTVTGLSQATAAANDAEMLRLQNRSKAADVARQNPAPVTQADTSQRLRDRQPAAMPTGTPAAQTQLAPNKYAGYDLGTKRGMLNFVADVAKANKKGLPVDEDMAATAQQIARSYLGINGNPEQVANQVRGMSSKTLNKAYEDTVPPMARWQQASQFLVDASNKAGVDAGIVAAIANYESGFDPQARPIAKTHPTENKIRQFDGTMAISSGYGYGQFLDDTWLGSLQKHGKDYGVANARALTGPQADALRKDLSLQAGMLAELTKENIPLGRKLGGPDDAANVYALHNLGGGEGSKFLRALRATPDTPVGKVLSTKTVAGNPSLYGKGDISVQAAYDKIAAAMKSGAAYATEARRLQAETRQP